MGPALWPGSADLPLSAWTACAWIIELDREPMDEAALEPELALLSDDERARARRFIRPRDRLRFARTRSALRCILANELGARPETLAFSGIGHGKPVLRPEAGSRSHPLRFNVSHSGGLALIALALGRDVGVDLEEIRPVSLLDRILESYFTSEESSWFRSVAPADRERVFFRGWTRKEAILKARGIGLAGLDPGEPTGFGTIEPGERFEPSGSVSGIDLYECRPRPGFHAALAIGPALA